MSNFVLNVRCNKCSSVFRTDGHDADFYNSFRKFVCGSCGHHGFHDASERWISESTWWKPWTWFRGYWDAAQQPQGGEDE